MKKIIGNIKNLSFSYDGEHNVLKDISFSIYEGETISIIGKNGTGKSTLAKILIGLITKHEGTLELFGQEVTNNNLLSVRNNVAIVFQNPDNQFVGSTVEDDIAFGLENTMVPHDQMESIVKTYASLVGMEKYLSFEPSNLSGGQKQRVAVAGVLALKPSILILDEATSMLDPEGKKDILSLVNKIKEENPKLTIISITHDIEETLNSDRILILQDGTLVKEGSPSEIFLNSPQREDLPFFYLLKNKLIKKGLNVPSSVSSLEELKEFLCK